MEFKRLSDIQPIVDDINVALKVISEKHGVILSIDKFTGHTQKLNTKLSIETPEQAKISDNKISNFLAKNNLPLDLIGKTFVGKFNEKIEVTGINFRATKNEISFLKEGISYKTSVGGIKTHLAVQEIKKETIENEHRNRMLGLI